MTGESQPGKRLAEGRRSSVRGVWAAWLGWMLGLVGAMWVIVWLTRASPHMVEANLETALAELSTTLPLGSQTDGRPDTPLPAGRLRPESPAGATGGIHPDPLSSSGPTPTHNRMIAPRTAIPPSAQEPVSATVVSTSSFAGPSPLGTDSSPEVGVLSFPSVSPIENWEPTAILTATAGASSPTASVPAKVPTDNRAVVSLPILDIPPCPSPSDSSHLSLSRPLAAGANDWASTYYPYGSTAGGEYLIHHGVDMGSPEGTVVLAVGPGTVLYAGDDRQRAIGPQTDFYGQLVLLEMDRKYKGETVYTLYGHLSLVTVTEGQRVSEGSRLGEVGATGIAMGPHLHFEVRMTDAYEYGATRNPELWLRPHPGRGLIAGRVLDSEDKPLAEVPLALYAAEDLGRTLREGWTYAGTGVNGDQLLLENVVWGDVAAGDWIVIADLPDVRLRQRVTVRPGEISWLCLRSPVPAG